MIEKLISKDLPKSAPLWRIFRRYLNLVIIVPLLTMSPTLEFRSKVQRDSAFSETGISDKVVHFAFISEIGGMVGGFSAISNSKYISRSGLIQVSKEETNGVLHELMTGHTDTSVFFENITKDSNFCPRMEKSVVDQNSNEVSEYYPPKTLMAYFFYGEKNVPCEYYGEVANTEAAKSFVNRVLDLTAKTKLYHATPGLYVRAQRILASNLNLIKFDLELEPSDLISFPILNKIFEITMALVRVREKDGRAVIADKIVIKAGDPIHIRIGKEAYLLFPYRYNPQK